MIRIVERILKGLKNGKNRKLHNSRVSNQRSHHSIATFPPIILQNITFFRHKSWEFGRAKFEAVIMQRGRGHRYERASSRFDGGGESWRYVK